MSSVPTTRLFVALWPDQALRDALREQRDRWNWPRGAAHVHTDKLHLTLHFLGGVATERLPELQARLAVPFAPFSLSLGLPTLWPHGIAVLEPHGAPPELLQLHADLASALVALGLEPEARSFRPHVTLARRANGAVVPPEGDKLIWQVDGYALVASTPVTGGYTVLQRFS